MAHTVKLTQSGSTLYDFQSSTVNVLSRYSPAAYDPKVKMVSDEMVLNPRGTTIAAFLDNLNTLNRTLEDAQDNFNQSQLGYPYTPIYLNFQQENSSYAVQAEVFGGETGQIENYISGALRGRLIHNLPFQLKRRPYFEETSAQSLYSNTVNNNNNPIAVSGVRGDVPAPLKITVQTDVASQNRIIIGCRTRGTISNFTSRYQAEAYTSRGSGVADRTDADLSGSAPQGQRWTPPATTEQELITWTITDPTDQLGVFRVYVRCRDNASTFNTKIRVRAGITTSGETNWGDYGDSAKYTDGTYAAGASNASPGTTSIPLIDCGIIQLPPLDTNGAIPDNVSIQLLGQATASGASYTFDIDEIFLMPTMELPYGGGFQVITLPENLGTGANPIAIIDANERTPSGYLDTSGVLQQVAADIRGKPLYAWTNKSMRLFILTQASSTLRHTHSANSTVVVTATPRYRFPGRGS